MAFFCKVLWCNPNKLIKQHWWKVKTWLNSKSWQDCVDHLSVTVASLVLDAHSSHTDSFLPCFLCHPHPLNLLQPNSPDNLSFYFYIIHPRPKNYLQLYSSLSLTSESREDTLMRLRNSSGRDPINVLSYQEAGNYS